MTLSTRLYLAAFPLPFGVVAFAGSDIFYPPEIPAFLAVSLVSGVISDTLCWAYQVHQEKRGVFLGSLGFYFTPGRWVSSSSESGQKVPLALNRFQLLLAMNPLDASP